MNTRKLLIIAIALFCYFILLALIDPRMGDGKLTHQEMKLYEFPVLISLLCIVFYLWFKGLAVAKQRKSVALFLLALFIWPFSIYLSISSKDVSSE